MDKRGQSIVETALMIPVVVLILLAAFQLLWIAAIKISLLAMASRVAQARAIDPKDLTTGVLESAPFFAKSTPAGFLIPRIEQQRSVLVAWKPYSGVHTLRGPGVLVTNSVRYRLHSKNLLRAVLPGRFLRARASLPEEPLVPGSRR